jgi:hypothetical protein
VAAWAHEHAEAIAVQAWLIMAASVPGVALLALVHGRINGPEATAYPARRRNLASAYHDRRAAPPRPRPARWRARPGTARVIADIEAYWGSLATFSILIQAVALTIATRSGVRFLAGADQRRAGDRAARRDRDSAR